MANALTNLMEKMHAASAMHDDSSLDTLTEELTDLLDRIPILKNGSEELSFLSLKATRISHDSSAPGLPAQGWKIEDTTGQMRTRYIADEDISHETYGRRRMRSRLLNMAHNSILKNARRKNYAPFEDAVIAPNKIVSLMREMNHIAGRASAECSGNADLKHVTGHAAAVKSETYQELFMLVSAMPAIKEDSGDLTLLFAVATRSDINPLLDTPQKGWAIEDTTGTTSGNWVSGESYSEGLCYALLTSSLYTIAVKAQAGDYTPYADLSSCRDGRSHLQSQDIIPTAP